MDEVRSILLALVALFVGLIGLGWAYGDFRKPSGPSAPGAGQDPPPPSPS